MLARANDRLVAAILLVATAMFGVSRAGRHPFWLDEAFTAVAAKRTFGSLVRFLGHEAGMGPYYLVLWAWARIGNSEGWLRALSVIGGALAVAAVYLLTVALLGRTAALVAAVALWCNPFFVYNLTELRAYSWTMWFAVVTVGCCVRFRASPSARTAVAWGVGVGLMLGALAFTAPLVIVEAAYLWPRRNDRQVRRLAVLAGAIAVLLFVPFVPALLRSDQINWIQPLTPHRFMQNTAEALGGYRWTAVLAAGNLALLATLVRSGWRTGGESPLRLVLAGVAAMPVGLAALEVVQPVFIPRYLSAMLPIAIIGALGGGVRLTRAVATPDWARRGGLVAVGLLLAAAVWSAATFDVPRPEDLRAPAAYVEAHAVAGDDVVFSSEQVAQAVGYYWAAPPPTPGACRHWYFFRGSRSELMASIGRPPDDGAVVTTDFLGYTIGELDRCAA
jgi:4-amino-4-deoxy-L-arabinose transferase-like glycosyltransferase